MSANHGGPKIFSSDLFRERVILVTGAAGGVGAWPGGTAIGAGMNSPGDSSTANSPSSSCETAMIVSGGGVSLTSSAAEVMLTVCLWSDTLWGAASMISAGQVQN